MADPAPSRAQPDGYYLSPPDYALFQRMAQQFRTRLERSRGLPLDPEDGYQAPETYVVTVPTGGIPARTALVPGVAECTVKQIDRNGPTIDVSGAAVVRVHNLSETEIDPATTPYIVSTRDKFGTYIALIPEGGNTGGGDCSSCAWLKWIAETPTRPCWTIYRRGGNGRCDCFATDDYANPLSGVVASYVDGLTGWLMVDPNTISDGAMAKTCCGCGSGLLGISAGVPTFTFGGVHVSCDGDGTTPPLTFSESLTDYCCGTLPDGRFYIMFFGSSANACSGAQVVCRNDYMVMAVCGATCPTPACGCVGCGAYPTPIAWKSTISGFTDNEYNGDWVWIITDPANPCTWVAVCNGITSTLTYISTGTPVWRLTHGSYVYEVTVSAGQCTSALGVIFTTTGTATGDATTITLVPVQAPGTAPTCCGGCDWEALKAKTLYLTILGTGESLDGTTISATYDSINDRFRFEAAWAGCNCTPTGVRADLTCSGGYLYMNSSVGEVGPCLFGDDPGNFLATTCEPFLATGDAILVTSCAGSTSTLGTFVLSESPP